MKNEREKIQNEIKNIQNKVKALFVFGVIWTIIALASATLILLFTSFWILSVILFISLPISLTVAVVLPIRRYKKESAQLESEVNKL